MNNGPSFKGLSDNDPRLSHGISFEPPCRNDNKVTTQRPNNATPSPRAHA